MKFRSRSRNFEVFRFRSSVFRSETFVMQKLTNFYKIDFWIRSRSCRSASYIFSTRPNRVRECELADKCHIISTLSVLHIFHRLIVSVGYFKVRHQILFRRLCHQPIPSIQQQLRPTISLLQLGFTSFRTTSTHQQFRCLLLPLKNMLLIHQR